MNPKDNPNIYGTPAWAKQQRHDQYNAKLDALLNQRARPSKGSIVGPSPSPVNYGRTNVGVRSGGGSGLLAGLAKLFVIGVIILGLGGYFGSHQSGPARRPSPSETTPRPSYATQPSYTSPPSAREGRDRKRREQAAADADRVPPTPPKASPPPERPTEPPRESKPGTVPPLDPNDDPIGAGGFITPSAQPTPTPSVQAAPAKKVTANPAIK